MLESRGITNKKLLKTLRRGREKDFLATMWKLSLHFQAATKQRTKTNQVKVKTAPALAGTENPIKLNNKKTGKSKERKLTVTPGGVKKMNL